MINTYQYKHHDQFKNLYDLCRKDWEEWSQTHDIEKETVLAKMVSGIEVNNKEGNLIVNKKKNKV